MNKKFIVMGICETGEHFRYCDKDFLSVYDAQKWIDANAGQYPESQLYVEIAPSYRNYWEQ